MNDGLSFMRERTWAQVDMDAICHNYHTIRRQLRAGVKLCCVVKANAYGHGVSRLAPLYQELGADWFAVSNIQEAMQLRRCGITEPVLILGYTPPACAAQLAENDLSQCVYSADYGSRLSACAVAAGVTVKIHIKVDTGMGRIGFVCPNGDVTEIAVACRLAGLLPEGIFTHFASADEGEAGDAFSAGQYAAFMTVVENLTACGITFSLRHCANSAALADYPEYQPDMVRAGIVLYGLPPSGQLRCSLDLQPAMSLHSVISHVKTVPAGTPLSYGRTFVTPAEMRVATVPIGYADGYWRHNGTVGAALTVAGYRAPIVGRVCMDQLLIDVTHLPEVHIGDRVVVFGTAPALTAQELAVLNDTIGYEVVCGVGERVPRLYTRGGEVVDVLDNILE